MPVEKVEVLVVGAGQAGVAMSEHLSRAGVPHLVLERARIAERWRTGRWDSLVANGPAWHDRFPGMDFPGDPEAFAPKEAVADYFVAYAEKFARADPLRRRGEARSTRCAGRRRLPRRDLGRRRSRRGASSPPPAPSSARSSRGSSPRAPASCRCIPPTTATPTSCRRARCSSSAPAPPARRSPRSWSRPAARSGSRSARTTARRAATAGATTSGGSACSTSGTWRPRRPPSTSPSRSAAPTAARPSTSAGSPSAGVTLGRPGRSPSPTG